MANIFNSVKGLHPKRNSFSSHTYRNDFTSQLGVNLPVYQQHVPPATRVQVQTSALVRLQALIAPIMDNIDYYVHFWKLPYRLIENDSFTKFISGEIKPADYNALFTEPYNLGVKIFEILGEQPENIDDYEAIVGNGSLLDFLGYDRGLFPVITDVSPDDPEIEGGCSWLPFNYRPIIAYYMLHLNWYMNENVEYWEGFAASVDSLVVEQDYEILATLLVTTYQKFGTTFLPHGWDKDYFTSALPNVQYGEAVTLPIAGTAPVSIAHGPTTELHIGPMGSPHNIIFGVQDADYYDYQSMSANNAASSKLFDVMVSGNNQDSQPITDIYGTLRSDLQATADLSNATAITINELRFANALQVFKERQMRFGRRRLEHYKGFFDVSPEDLRLQVPKYLGGGRIPINIADIEQTSQTSGTSALGHLAGKATAVAGNFAGFETFCSEESVIIGIAFAMPHITYAQSVSRFLFKTNDPYDYFNPSFEHLGEQQIDKIEIYSAAEQDSRAFGYTPRFNEYRFHSNEMHGEFKDSLAYWTLGRIFESQPSLNAKFIYMQPSVFDRIFAVSGQPSMLVSMLFRQRIVQPVSKYGTPMLLA